MFILHEAQSEQACSLQCALKLEVEVKNYVDCMKLKIKKACFFHEVEKNVHCILEKNVVLHEEGIIKERLLPKLKSMFIAYRNWK